MREEEKKRSSQDSSMKRFFKKRWAFPAIYIASAAIILTAVLWYQNSNSATDSDQYDYEATDIAGKKYNEPAVEVNRSLENFVMPVADPNSVVIHKQFYDYEGTTEEQEAALVFYNNSYHPNTGIDITMENGEAFEVVAALSGTVTKVEEDSLLGNVIEIEHDKGIVTQYQSIKDMSVKVGDQVEQGQALATAGESLYNEEAGVHVHFEIRKDGVPVNPIDFFNKPLSSLQEVNVMEEEETDDSGKTDVEEGTTDSDASTDKEAEDGESGDKESDKTDKEEDGTSETEEGTESTDSSNT
ncbi:peptidoglycan DD-metalloendopeptidase family protein [Cytobacillus sp. FJAT-54145]|uniref:Peptidoglycan DD-metalloendopeptidase family protein n=1 Tax=Cytobacillus spartinae TaxID=3299023 RepID=A0ABW6KC46_9BACI